MKSPAFIMHPNVANSDCRLKTATIEIQNVNVKLDKGSSFYKAHKRSSFFYEAPIVNVANS